MQARDQWELGPILTQGKWRGQTGENEDGNKGPSGRNTQGRSPSKEAKRDKVQWDDTG